MACCKLVADIADHEVTNGTTMPGSRPSGSRILHRRTVVSITVTQPTMPSCRYIRQHAAHQPKHPAFASACHHCRSCPSSATTDLNPRNNTGMRHIPYVFVSPSTDNELLVALTRARSCIFVSVLDPPELRDLLKTRSALRVPSLIRHSRVSVWRLLLATGAAIVGHVN